MAEIIELQLSEIIDMDLAQAIETFIASREPKEIVGIMTMLWVAVCHAVIDDELLASMCLSIPVMAANYRRNEYARSLN